MNNWKHIATEVIEVPKRSSGNTINNLAILFDVYKDDVLYKAIPRCGEEEKVLANLKEELLFSFYPHKAVSANGILDANQHIVERIGEVLRAKEQPEKTQTGRNTG